MTDGDRLRKGLQDYLAGMQEIINGLDDLAAKLKKEKAELKAIREILIKQVDEDNKIKYH